MALLIPVKPLPFTYAGGCQVSRASTTTITVGAGQTRDSTNTIDIIISSTKTINGAVVGVNGIDKGALENNKWYAVHIIGDSTNYKQPAALISLSATAPTLPQGYDAFRRVGWMRTGGSATFLDVYIHGNSNERQYFWNLEVAAALVLNAGNETSYTAQSLASLVAPTSRIAHLKASYTAQAAGEKYFLRPTDSGLTELVSIASPVAAQPMGDQIRINTNASQSIDYHVTGTGALSLWVLGFEDFI